MDNEKGAVKRMAAYAERLSEYRRVREPNKEAVAELVKKARGPSRSLRQFAGELNVTPSTVSKVENNKATGISDELLANIAEHASPESGVSLDDLLSANGMERDRHLTFRSKAAEFERQSASIIKDEMFRTDYKATDASGLDVFIYGRIGRPILMLKTDALDDKDSLWLFSCMYSLEDNGERRGITAASMMITDRISAIMSTFYCNTGEIGKWSILMNSKRAYDECKRRIERRFEGRRIKDLISLILIDEEKGYVIDEWTIPSEKKEVSIFSGEPHEAAGQREPEEGQLTFEDYMHFSEFMSNEEGNE